MEDMVRDTAGPGFDWSENAQQEPSPAAKKFINAMESAKDKLYPGSEKTVLEAVADLLNIKSNCNISQSTYNRIMKAVKGWLPQGNKLVKNFYETKKLIGHIGLGYEKIDACKNDCMLFYKKDSSKTDFFFVGIVDISQIRGVVRNTRRTYLISSCVTCL